LTVLVIPNNIWRTHLYQILFYRTGRGDVPVSDVIARCDEVTQAKFQKVFPLLIERGPVLKRPYADKVRGKIYELRVRQLRVLYFFADRQTIIFLHAFLKKRDEIKNEDIEIAEKRSKDWFRRSQQV
jgi:hypothetical protein